ncbi:MAG: pentapeptide repeat-containing protein, partial [Ktedonobacteraceae bacterium]
PATLVHDGWSPLLWGVLPKRGMTYSCLFGKSFSSASTLPLLWTKFRYLDWLEEEIKRRGIDRMYVPLACSKEDFDPITKNKIGESRYDQRNGWIEGYIDRWLDDTSKEHISILGEFGTGKTWFVLYYAWISLKRYREAKARGTERPRLPLVVPLRDYAKAVSVESLFSEFFFRKYEIPLPGYSAFEQLNRMGKLLLLFDGFDEMADRVDRQKMINNFWELARVVVPGAKVILTCRTEHFPNATEGRALLSAELQASVANLSGESPQFEVLKLDYFDDDQIRQVLSFRTNTATVESIMGNKNLQDLARRPVMTEIILTALPDIDSGKPVDLSRVYLYAVRHKLEEDIKNERTFTSLADKLYFLSELSWEMLSTDQMSLNYRLFPDRIRHLFGPVVQEKKDLDHWHYDMMGQTLLIRNDDGDYTPAHRSLLEFFVAYKFAAELGVLAPDFMEISQSQSNLDENIASQNYTWSFYFRRIMQQNGTAKLIPPLRNFVTESIDNLVSTVGTSLITPTILQLMVNMLSSNKEETNERLLSVINETRDKPKEAIGFIGGNTASLLAAYDSFALKGRDLSGVDINHAYLIGCDLSGCIFDQTNLSFVNFVDSKLAGASLRKCDLYKAVVAEVYRGWLTRWGLDDGDLCFCYNHLQLRPDEENYQILQTMQEGLSDSEIGIALIADQHLKWKTKIESSRILLSFFSKEKDKEIILITSNSKIFALDVVTCKIKNIPATYNGLIWHNADLTEARGLDGPQIFLSNLLGARGLHKDHTKFKNYDDESSYFQEYINNDETAAFWQAKLNRMNNTNL